MKITYWGTAAAEGIPGLFCACEVCRTARERKGRHIRTRSQCLINDDLIIDFGPDTLMHTISNGIGLSGIRDVLITHTHADHFSPMELHYRDGSFCHGLQHPTMHVHGSADATELARKTLQEHFPRVLDNGVLTFHTLAPFVTATVGAYRITPLPATHGTKSPFVYSIAYKDSRILYLHDTGVLSNEVIAFLQEQGERFDLISYDCTHGMRDVPDRDGHMGIPSADRLRKRLTEHNLCKDDTLHVLNHFSHNGQTVSYDEFLPLAAAYAFIVAYDGYALTL